MTKGFRVRFFFRWVWGALKVADESSDEHMIAAVAACVSQLPERNRVILEALASFFTEVSSPPT